MKTVDKASTRTTKRNVEPQAPVRAAGAGSNRRGPSGSEGGEFILLSPCASPLTDTPFLEYLGTNMSKLSETVPLAVTATRAAPLRSPPAATAEVATVPASVVVSDIELPSSMSTYITRKNGTDSFPGRGSRHPRDRDDRHPSKAGGFTYDLP